GRRAGAHPHDLSRSDQRLRPEVRTPVSSMRVTTAGLIALLVAIGSAVPASAHRLDEYLQALRVDLRADGIVLELDLTPGAYLAADLVATLDANADRAIDVAEADAYVASVLRSLELSVDDHRVGLDLISRTIP